MKWLRCCIVLLSLCVVVRFVGAQGALDPTAEPEAGTAAFAPGFTPDPYRIPAVGGGDIDANSRTLGQDCVGFIAIQPDFRLTAQETFPLLRFIFIADTITTDTSLIIRTPDGRFLCNNDALGIFNPMVDVTDATAGDYVVWVGGFRPAASVYGDLYITTNSTIIPGSTGVVIPVASTPATTLPLITATPIPIAGTALNPALPAAHGNAALEAGFLPDPYWAVVVGGGLLPVPALNENTVEGEVETLPECGGYTDSAPDFRLEWSGRSTRLRFHFIPIAAGGLEPDTALIVQSPTGEWVCNRDFAPGFTQPSAELINPAVGVYHIWIADEAEANTAIIGVLYVTEISSTPETVHQVVAPPLVDLVGLDAGEVNSPITDLTFSPDPFVMSGIIAGGFVDIATLNPDLSQPNSAQACTGFYGSTPTLVLNLEQPLPYLRAFFVADNAEDDPALIVRMPNGEWYCGDDSFDTLNPTVHIVGNLSSGTMRVWAGSYSANEIIPGTLYLTQGNASPTQDGVIGVPTPTLAAAELTSVTLPTAVLIPTLPLATNAAGLDPFAAPNYGIVSLGAAVVPYTLEANGGGTLDVASLGETCVGFVTAQPDFRVQWSGTRDFLRFYFVGLADTTLVVYGTDGTWHCNDDSYASVNPTVDVTNAVPGTYNLWIGSYDAGLTVPGTLYITEDTSRTPGN